MKSIWRYPVYSGPFEVQIPRNARFLSVRFQYSHSHMWFEVNPKADPEVRHFYAFGTMRDIPDDFKGCYLGTWQDGEADWHLYEVETVQLVVN